MSPEKTYEIIVKKYFIPYNVSNDPKDVERRQKEIEEELRDDLQRISNVSDTDLQRVFDFNCYIIEDNCSFEKLENYDGRTETVITENDYCIVFTMVHYVMVTNVYDVMVINGLADSAFIGHL